MAANAYYSDTRRDVHIKHTEIIVDDKVADLGDERPVADSPRKAPAFLCGDGVLDPRIAVPAAAAPCATGTVLITCAWLFPHDMTGRPT